MKERQLYKKHDVSFYHILRKRVHVTPITNLMDEINYFFTVCR